MFRSRESLPPHDSTLPSLRGRSTLIAVPVVVSAYFVAAETLTNMASTPAPDTRRSPTFRFRIKCGNDRLSTRQLLLVSCHRACGGPPRG